MFLSDVCLSVWRMSRTWPKSRTEMHRKTKIGTEVAHVTVTRIPLLMSKGQRSRSPGRFTHRRVGASAPGSCSGGHGNVLAVRNCCCRLLGRERRFGVHGGRRGAGHIVAAARLQLVEFIVRLYNKINMFHCRKYWTDIRWHFVCSSLNSISY